MTRTDIIRRGVRGTDSVMLTPTPPGGDAQDAFAATLRNDLTEDFGERARRSRARYYLAANEDLPDGFGRGWHVEDDGVTFEVASVDRSKLGLARIDVKKA